MDSILKQTPALWEQENAEVILENGHYTIYKKLFRHPKRQTVGEFYIAEVSSGVILIPLTRDNKIVLVQQYRFGCQQLVWEFPGGGIDKNESPIECGIRELLEETGYAGEDPVLLASCYSNPSFLTNQLHYIGIKNSHLVSPPAWDEHEELLVKEVTLEQLKAMVISEEICNTMTLTGLMLAHAKGFINW